MTGIAKVSQECTGCGETEGHKKFQQCSVCKITYYCSRKCQVSHWSEHKENCEPFARHKKRTEQIRSCKMMTDRKGDIVTKEQSTVTELVGKKCLVHCYLQGNKTEVLWDTGSQVSAIDEVWKTNYLPNIKLRDIAEIVDSNDPLQVEAANGTEMPYVGWIEVTFRLEGAADEFHVPMLVMRGSQQSCPIIGFNVIERVVISSQNNQTNTVTKEKLIKTVKLAFPNLKKRKAEALIIAVSVERMSEYLVKTACQRMTIPSHCAVQVECRILARSFKDDTTLLFEPDGNPHWPEGLEFCDTLVQVRKGARPNIILSVQNPTDHDIMLTGRVVIGTAQPVTLAYPLSPVKEAHPSADINKTQAYPAEQQRSNTEFWDPPIDLSHLDDGQTKIVREMLREESSSFSRSDNDIGCIERLQLDISLKDPEPVVRSYMSVPKPLYEEMKDYLRDLIAQGWIERSHSSYASPVVCV